MFVVVGDVGVFVGDSLAGCEGEVGDEGDGSYQGGQSVEDSFGLWEGGVLAGYFFFFWTLMGWGLKIKLKLEIRSDFWGREGLGVDTNGARAASV